MGENVGRGTAGAGRSQVSMMVHGGVGGQASDFASPAYAPRPGRQQVNGGLRDERLKGFGSISIACNQGR
jgi:hypothetical protein